MPKYQAIIFDMNGVIVDDEPIHLKADIITCEKFGLKVPPEEWPKIKGWKSREIFESFIERFADKKIDADQMVESKVKTYLELTKDHLEPIAGAIDFIKAARQIFPKVALATSTLKPLQELVFERFGLDGYFDVIIASEDLEKGKPDPDSYLKAASKLDLPPSECLVIEDSINGVISGKRAGCTVLAITTTYKRKELEKAGADFVFDNFEEALAHKTIWQ